MGKSVERIVDGRPLERWALAVFGHSIPDSLAGDAWGRDAVEGMEDPALGW